MLVRPSLSSSNASKTSRSVRLQQRAHRKKAVEDLDSESRGERAAATDTDLSSELVASSQRRILLRLRNARARATRCFSPPLSFRPLGRWTKEH